jgi:arsenite methyltransferase
VTQDRWADWLLDRRDGGSARQRARTLDRLGPVRDRVLDGAAIAPGDVVVDVGCGDGMIGLGALDRVGAEGHVVFVDPSPTLLERCRAEVVRRGLAPRATFVEAAAERLAPLPSAAADVVTTRSVLIYVVEKAHAFQAFRRVLRAGGRISLWEPINVHGFPEPAGRLFGYDVRAVESLAEKVKAAQAPPRPPERSPMLDFDERDLLAQAEAGGFVALALTLEVTDRAPDPVEDWDVFLDSSPNPLAPTWREAVAEALDAGEARAFLAHLRPRAEAGEGRWRHAVAHLVGRAG